MRLSIPLGSAPKHVTIHSAEAIAYRVPMDLASEDTQRTVAPLNYLVVLSGRTAGGRELTGVGEAQPRLRQTGDEHDLSWPFLDDALRGLVGYQLESSRPLSQIGGLVDQFELTAGIDELNQGSGFRATIMGIEAALLDLTAKAAGRSLADLLGRRRVRPLTMPKLMRHRSPEEIEEFFAALPRGRNRALRLIGTGDVDADLEHLRLVTQMRNDTRPGGVDAPLWINFQGRLDPVQARRAMNEIAQSVERGEVTKDIVVQNPLPADDYLACLSLQEYADELAAELDGPLTIKVLPRNVGPTAAQELMAQGTTSLRMVNLRPSQLGGVMRTLRLMESSDTTKPLEVLLTHFPGASRVTQMLHRDLSQVLPHASHLVTTADIEKRFRLSRRSSSWRRSPLLRQGNGLAVDYGSLVHKARSRIFWPEPQKPETSTPPPNSYDDVRFISPIGPYAVHGHIIEREALAYGLNSWRFTKSSFVATTDSGEEIMPFRRSRWPLSGVAAASIAKNKEATRILLKRAGCPVPAGRTFAGGDTLGAEEFAARIGYPVVVKPAEGSMGIGVVANIASVTELRKALAMLGRTVHGQDDFIVERHISGADYRIMVIGEEVVAAVKRRPASVVGDGRQTVGQLMIEKNIERQSNPHLGQLPIQWNESSAHELAKSGYGFDDIPAQGKRLDLSSTSNLTQGGDSIDVLEELHPSIREIAVRAARAVPGMAYCGVDFLIEDHTQPVDLQGGAICELNVMAALPVGEYPAYGKPRPLAERFIQECAHAFSVPLRSERAEYLQLELAIRGGVIGVGYRNWFARRAVSFGVTGWIRKDGERELRARICGPTVATTAIITAAILGPPKASPESIYTTHSGGTADQEFQVLDLEREIDYESNEEDLIDTEVESLSQTAQEGSQPLESDDEVA